MDLLEKLEKRWSELAGKPKSSDEIKETLELAKKIELERAKEYSGLIKELSDIGIKVNTIWDLVNTKSKYPTAIPILLKYLPLMNLDKNKEGIVRALTVPEAKGMAANALINEYVKIPVSKENLRWIIGNAIKLTLTDCEIEKVFSIVKDKKNGISREMFVLALGKTKKYKKEAIELLIHLTYDDDVKLHAIEALTKLKAIEAKERITKLASSSEKLVQKKAVSYLKKMG